MKRQAVILVGALVFCSAGCETKPATQTVEPTIPKGDTASRPASGGSPPDVVVSQDGAHRLTDPPKLLNEEQLRDGWIALFDGRTLFGWTANSDTNWQVRDGEIASTSPAGLLLTTNRFKDYELRCDVWLESGGNSGLFLRTVAQPMNPAKDCLEFNLCDGHKSYPTGSLVGREVGNGSASAEGGWHRIDIVVDANHMSAKIDGKAVLDAESNEFTTTGGSYIGLQQNGGKVRFRNVFLKPLGMEPILNAALLSDWRPTVGANLKAETDENAVRLRGVGYLESESTYDDFVLQFEAKLNAEDVNSGLFFRAQPSTEESPSDGYELQLQNTIADGDRTKPADYGEGFGTGAIFRRQRARYVNADDGEWFAVTLVADGNHFASWVNGLQVTDYRDERPADSNPRKGRRDDAGHLSFQGHDATTDASFRNVNIRPSRFE